MEILSVKDIHTAFGQQKVHSGVSFAINQPGVVALIGGSGTGKSVLLREILGLMRPTQGVIKVLGHDIAKLSVGNTQRLQQRYGVLFQNGALFSALSVEENVALPLVEQGALKSETIREIVAAKLALAGLSPEVGPKMPAALSGGMRKRVALARALALEPELLFLDEPTSGLDPINARAFDQLIRILANSLGLSVFMITHDLATLRTICDSVIALADGRVLCHDSVEKVAKFNHPWVHEYFNNS